MSVTWNSSKHKSQASSKIKAAVSPITSASAISPRAILGAALVLDRTVLKEQVHQHGLAAADLAVNIEAARRRAVLVREQPAEQALLAHRRVAGKPLLEIGECLDGLRLSGVGLDGTGRYEGLILGAEHAWRGREHGLLYGTSATKIASRELVRELCAFDAAGWRRRLRPRKRVFPTSPLRGSITGAGRIPGRRSSRAMTAGRLRHALSV
jgi:hypothetical protein